MEESNDYLYFNSELFLLYDYRIRLDSLEK